MAQLRENVPSMHKALDAILRTTNPGATVTMVPVLSTTTTTTTSLAAKVQSRRCLRTFPLKLTSQWPHIQQQRLLGK